MYPQNKYIYYVHTKNKNNLKNIQQESTDSQKWGKNKQQI